jgi:hypothetical protein
MPLQNAEVTALAIGAAWAASIIWTKKRDNTEWVPSAPFHWERKRAAMAELSASDIIVITDFDATITTGDSEQCHDLVGASKLLPEEFRKEFCPLLDWTSNTQIDGVEWWDKAVSLPVLALAREGYAGATPCSPPCQSTPPEAVPSTSASRFSHSAADAMCAPRPDLCAFAAAAAAAAGPTDGWRRLYLRSTRS